MRGLPCHVLGDAQAIRVVQIVGCRARRCALQVERGQPILRVAAVLCGLAVLRFAGEIAIEIVRVLDGRRCRVGQLRDLVALIECRGRLLDLRVRGRIGLRFDVAVADRIEFVIGLQIRVLRFGQTIGRVVAIRRFFGVAAIGFVLDLAVAVGIVVVGIVRNGRAVLLVVDRLCAAGLVVLGRADQSARGRDDVLASAREVIRMRGAQIRRRNVGDTVQTLVSNKPRPRTDKFHAVQNRGHHLLAAVVP